MFLVGPAQRLREQIKDYWRNRARSTTSGRRRASSGLTMVLETSDIRCPQIGIFFRVDFEETQVLRNKVSLRKSRIFLSRMLSRGVESS